MRRTGMLAICCLTALVPVSATSAQETCDLLDLKQRFDRQATVELESDARSCVQECLDDLVEPPCRGPEVASLVLSYFPVERGEGDCHVQLRDAQKSYEVGRFQRALDELQRCLDSDRLRQTQITARALEARILIATDDVEAARAVQQLACLDPTYSPQVFDAPRFVSLLAQAKLAAFVPRSVEQAAELCAKPVPPVRRRPVRETRRVLDGCTDCVWDVGVEAGFFVPDKDLSGKSQKFFEVEPQSGIRVGRKLGDRWRWFGTASFADWNSDSPGLPPPAPGRQDVDALAFTTGAELLSKDWRGSRAPWKWFAGFGIGRTHYNLEFENDVWRSVASVAAGQRVKLDARARLLWALRLGRTLNDAGFGGEEIGNADFMISVTWLVGKLN